MWNRRRAPGLPFKVLLAARAISLDLMGLLYLFSDIAIPIPYTTVIQSLWGACRK